MQTGQQGSSNQPGGNVQSPPVGQPVTVQATPPPIVQPQVQQPAGQPTAQPQSAAQPMAQPAATQPAGGAGGGDGGLAAPTYPGDPVIPIAQSQFKRIKDDAQEKGRQAALEELAKESGYNSVEAMQAALKDGGKRPTRTRPQVRRRSTSPTGTARGNSAMTQPRQTSTDPNADANGDGEGAPGVDMKAWQRQMRRMEIRQRKLEERDTVTRKKLATESRRSNRFRREKDLMQTEMALREIMVRHGVRDVDYAMRQYTRHLNGKSQEDIEKFNHDEFFLKTLKESHPYLYGEVRKPMTTGNGADAPSAPNPGAAQQGAAQGSQVDARKMDQKQFNEHLRTRGLSLSI